MTKMIKLGETAIDKITGFVGVVTGRCSYITGCDQLLVQPQLNKEGAFVESKWFDENRLTSDSKVETIVVDTEVDKGPCCPAPIK